ncbi:Pentatricopeptide repeat-containing protein [Quillaja saponaria]|uniref:Pentatricopeptide repeat-containing protein n=1 Tax=Quillaja saponaria TaxID=32244 RepID=A0AAD7VLB8_QUISA|nr:Pentatricopeptide repeat-containing protein [Quillaja saponaria]
MLPKSQIRKLFPRRNTNFNGFHYFLYNNFFSTMIESPQITESPELPGWVKFSENACPVSIDSVDDFVIPSIANWVDAQKLDDHNKSIRHVPREIIHGDVEAISKVLKKRYPSPQNVAQTLDGCGFHVSISLVEQVLKRFSNDWVPALGVFNWAKAQTGYKHSPELYNLIVDISGKSRKFSLMWELVEEMDQLEGYVTLATMTRVMRRFSKAGGYKEAIEAFRQMERFNVRKDTNALNALMDALVKENSVEHAHDVFLEFKSLIPLNSHTFNILIHGWCKARNLEQAGKAMEDMKNHGFHPDVFSYTCFIEAYCHEKDFRRVDEVLHNMKEKGCPPNVVTYTIVMHALGKAKQINAALEVYEKMKHNGCVPDVSFYSSLIFILGQAGRLKDARDVFEDMSKQGVSPDVLTFNTMISTACAHSQEETALKLLKEMEENSCKPNLKTYAPLLKMCCRKKRMKVLDFLLNHMFRNDLSIEVGTYSLLVHGLCKNGKLERACSFFEEMVLKGLAPNDCTYKMLVKELEGKSMLKTKQHIEDLMSQAQNKRSC